MKSDLISQYKQAGLPDGLAEKLAKGNISSSSTIPVKRVVNQNEELFKFMPKDSKPGQSSYYFTKNEFERFKANPEKLAKEAGLPYQNFVGEYDVYKISPKQNKSPSVFESKVAEIEQGGYRAEGGAKQTIVPNLKDWKEPEKVGNVKAY